MYPNNSSNPYVSWPQAVSHPNLPYNLDDDDSKHRSPTHDNEPAPKYAPGLKLVPQQVKQKAKPVPSGVSELVFHDSTDVTHTSIMTEPVNPHYSNPVVEHLDLNNFKVTPCAIPTAHNHKQCPFYHNAKDRKRPGTFYTPELCDAAERDDGLSCPAGDMCGKSHNRVE